MNAVLAVLGFVLCASIVFLVPIFAAPGKFGPSGATTILDTASAVLLCLVVGGVSGYIIRGIRPHGQFLLRLFSAALMIRMLIGTMIYVSNGQTFFGGDALTYDAFGSLQLEGWLGDRYCQMVAKRFTGQASTGWGMVYLVASVYWVLGRNMLAVQFLNAVLGAATAPVIFLCAQSVFDNARVSRMAAFFTAFTPSLVLWSSQGLKDGPIMFFLALSILSTLRLTERFSSRYLIALASSLFCVLTLRFYVFYMIAIAIAGALIIGMGSMTSKSLIRQLFVMIVVGLALAYLGVTRYAGQHFETYGSLEAVQQSRAEAAGSANSGFAREADVSTSAGALKAIPTGMLYLLFSPFPWQVGSLRQAITLPEMILWWSSCPLLVLGLWYSIRYRLRQICPILIFTVILSLAYSVFQGNVGNCYRQRAQLLVFYFIFVAVGYVLVREYQEKRQQERRAIEPLLR